MKYWLASASACPPAHCQSLRNPLSPSRPALHEQEWTYVSSTAKSAAAAGAACMYRMDRFTEIPP